MPTLQFDASPSDFEPVEYLDGYLPIEDYGIIGDCSTAALVGRDGTISWLCAPSFDSDPIFCSILDRELGGAFTIDAGKIIGARHRYIGDTPILVTELKLESGILRITDLMPTQAGADLNVEGNVNVGELLRCVEIVEGTFTVRARISLRGGCEAERHEDGYRLSSPCYPGMDLVVESSCGFSGTHGEWTLERGESVTFCLRWNGGTGASSVDAPVAAVTNTTETWLRWMRAFTYEGPNREHVKRSALTIKLLDYLPPGALVAAPTTSLPEQIGGERNWDYRYVWVRDAAFTVNALRRIGLDREAWQFLTWVLATAQGSQINPMYTLYGEPQIPESLDPELSGYRGSAPVRWGNAASSQIQHDVYGELVDCAYQWANRGGMVNDKLWGRLHELVERAGEVWRTPDTGIWEVRTPGRIQTYSAGLCHVALDRGTRLARRFELAGNVEEWERKAQRIQRAILEDAWDEEQQFLTQTIRTREDGQGQDLGHLDAALLSLPLRRVIPGTHSKMVKTAAAIEDQLGAGDGLLYRYLHDKSPDGLSGNEGAFALCSFWMIDNLTLQGRLQEAADRYDRMCARTNRLGLLPEEIDPGTGRFLGNFPQAFSHLGLITSGVNIGRAMESKNQETSSASS
jgi:GH15 family glucan-1,4-alpha-glucosidase